MAEDTDLVAALDELEASKGPRPITCIWWESATPEQREAVVRNVERTSATLVYRKLRSLGMRVTAPGIKEHAAEKCQCQT